MIHTAQMSTQRTENLRKASIAAPRSVSIARAKAFTDAFIKHRDKPLIIKRALAFSEFYETVPISIYENELIVGAITEKRRGAFLVPETNIDGMASGGPMNQAFKNGLDKMIGSAANVVSLVNPALAGQVSMVSLLAEAKLDNFENRSTLRFEIAAEEREELNNTILPYWKTRNAYDQYRKYLSAKEKYLMDVAIAYAAEHQLIGGVFLFHPNLEKVAQKGLREIIVDAQNKLQRLKTDPTPNQDQIDFYEAIIITCRAVITFAHRYADLAESMAAQEASPKRKNELLEMARICRTVPENKARTFKEGLQSLWLAFIAAANDDGGHEVPFGRWDQVLYPLYQSDLNSGRITREEALELLEAYLIKADEVEFLLMNKAQAFEDGNSARITLTIGGVDESGQDATNEISYLFLEALSNTRHPKPNTAIRLHKNTPEPFLSRVVVLMADEANTIQVFNDEKIISGFVANGFSLEEARAYIITGCVQPIPKATYGSVCASHLSLPKTLELFLKKTPEVNSFEAFFEHYQAFNAEILSYLIKTLESVDRIHDELIPNTFISAISEGPMEKGRDIKKGSSKNNLTGIALQGMGTTVDSLMVLKKAVFEGKRFSLRQLKKMLRNNYQGYEQERLYLVNKIAKFGNDVDEVDGLADRMVTFFNQVLKPYTTYRGGRYGLGVHTENGQVILGLTVGPTPDGRKMSEPLTLGAGSGHGREKRGITAALKSYAKYDFAKTIGGLSVHMRLNPTIFDTQAKLKRFQDLLATYFFEYGGTHLMTTVVNAETLKKAQMRPDDYRDLLVRISGYSARFVELTERTQDEVISRTAFG